MPRSGLRNIQKANGKKYQKYKVTGDQKMVISNRRRVWRNITGLGMRKNEIRKATHLSSKLENVTTTTEDPKQGGRTDPKVLEGKK